MLWMPALQGEGECDMTAEHSMGKGRSLTDEELARLLEADLDASERAALLERLESDEDACRILGLAAGELRAAGEGLSDATIERLLKAVREKRPESDICPHCAGDLHPGGRFCPHCAAQVVGNPLTCLKCGKPVREGSAYCPHCGSFFRPVERKSVIESPLFLLVLGLVSLAIAAVTIRLSLPVFIVFLAIGCVTLGGWFMETWVRLRRSVPAPGRREAESREEKERASQKKSG